MWNNGLAWRKASCSFGFRWLANSEMDYLQKEIVVILCGVFRERKFHPVQNVYNKSYIYLWAGMSFMSWSSLITPASLWNFGYLCRKSYWFGSLSIYQSNCHSLQRLQFISNVRPSFLQRLGSYRPQVPCSVTLLIPSQKGRCRWK